MPCGSLQDKDVASLGRIDARPTIPKMGAVHLAISIRLMRIRLQSWQEGIQKCADFREKG